MSSCSSVRAPRPSPVLELGPAERIDAIVEMNNPGIWIMGATDDKERASGMGIVFEYAGQTGQPRWLPPSSNAAPHWDAPNGSRSSPPRNPSTRQKPTSGRPQSSPHCARRSPRRCFRCRSREYRCHRQISQSGTRRESNPAGKPAPQPAAESSLQTFHERVTFYNSIFCA